MVTRLCNLAGSALAVLLLAGSSFGQLIRYDVSWQEPNGHFYDVGMSFANPENGPVSVRIPAWRPGRYIIQNYARDVVAFAAQDSSGTPLTFRKTDKGTWEISASPAQPVTVTYRVYARKLDAGSSYLDESEAYLNPITALMYIPGHELEPVVLSIDKPEDWLTATPLDYRADLDGYWAGDYHEMVDSPFIMSPTLKVHSFEQAGVTFEVAIQGDVEYDEGRLLGDLRKIVTEQTNLMGVIPFDRYVFMYHFVPHLFGHGVEHKNSTSIVVGPAKFDDPGFYRRLLGVSSHELWHAWLVERIRPEAIYLPDYSEEQYTTTMWIYEGITSYYGSLAMVRAGLISDEDYIKMIAGVIQQFEESPARGISSVAMSSWDSWTKTSDPPPYTTYSFYTAGQILGLLLDLEVRGRTRNLQSLDDVMRYLYQMYAARDLGVPESGMQEALETITNGTFQPFFDDHVNGTRPIDYNRFLYHAGYALVKGTDPNRTAVQLGIEIANGADNVKVAAVRPDGGAFEAGIDIDDVILAIDGRRVTRDNLASLYEDRSPGDTVAVTVFRKERLREFYVELKGGANTTYELQHMQNTTVLQNQIRREWLNLHGG